MTKTYAQLQEQIATLQAEAERVRREELAAIVTRLRDEIRAYGITPQDLFGKGIAKSARKSKTGPSAPAKYTDGAGNFWVGRGPRPQWLRDALAAGRRLEEFASGASKPRATPPAKRASAKSPPTKAAVRRRVGKK